MKYGKREWEEMIELKKQLGVKKITKESIDKNVRFYSLVGYFKANAMDLTSERRKVLRKILEG